MNQWQIYLTRTCPMFEPVLNETHYFSHYPENSFIVLCSSSELGCSLRGFSLIHEILLGSWDATNFISQITHVENRREPTLYAAPIQENTVFAIGFTCFELDNGHPCFSRMIYRADSLYNFNTHFHTIACRSKTAQNGLKIVQLVYRALDLCIQSAQVTVMSLWLNLIRNFHVESDWVYTSATIQNFNPEISSLKSALNFTVVPWAYRKRLRQRSTHIFLSSVIQKTRCFQRSSNLMLTWHSRSPSEARPKVTILLRRDFL